MNNSNVKRWCGRAAAGTETAAMNPMVEWHGDPDEDAPYVLASDYDALEREVAELRKTLRSLRATFDAIHDRHYDNQDCDEDASGHRSPNRDMNTVVDCSVALDEIERVEPKSQSAQGGAQATEGTNQNSCSDEA